MRRAIAGVFMARVFFVTPAFARHDDVPAPRGSEATFGEPQSVQAP